MVDVFDRAATLNSTCVATIRGRLSEAALLMALRKLERRHPLLRARIAREGAGASFVMGSAAPIVLRVLDREPADWQALAESSLVHRVWLDAGPRAELTWLRHSPQHSTLLFTLHNLVSDALSGFLALRDLLGFLADPSHVPEPVVSPGQRVLYPEQHGDLRWKLRALKLMTSRVRATKPRRLHKDTRGDVRRSPKLAQVTFTSTQTQSLRSRAREHGSSLHGLICAALAQGYVEAGHWSSAPLRLCHPIDLRRQARSERAHGPSFDAAVGHFASYLDTDHAVSTAVPLAELAREITRAIANKKATGEPWLTGPLVGPTLTRPVAGQRDLARFGDFLERNVLINSFAVSSLGALEDIGLQPQLGAYRVEQAFFVSGGSVVTALSTTTSSYAGRLTLSMQWVEPLIAGDVARHVLGHAERELNEFSARPRASLSQVKLR